MAGAVAAETVAMVADTLAAAAAGQLLLNPSSTEGADRSSDHRHQSFSSRHHHSCRRRMDAMVKVHALLAVGVCEEVGSNDSKGDRQVGNEDCQQQ